MLAEVYTAPFASYYLRELPLRNICVGIARPSFLPLPFRINRPPGGKKRNVNKTYGERAVSGMGDGGGGGQQPTRAKFLDLKHSSPND